MLYKATDTIDRTRLMTQHHYIYLYQPDLYKSYIGWLKTDLALKHGWKIKKANGIDN